MTSPALTAVADMPKATAKKSPRPSLHDKAVAETLKAREAQEKARALQQEAEHSLNHLVGRILRGAAKADSDFAQHMKVKLRAAKLTRREAAELHHLINEP